jgi:hypothetical protein
MDWISKRIDEAQGAASLNATICERELTSAKLDDLASQSCRDTVKRLPVRHNEWHY